MSCLPLGRSQTFMIFITLLLKLAQTSEHIPNVIIGDPYLDRHDYLGPAISEAEFDAAMADDTLTHGQYDDSPLSTQDLFFQGDIQLESKEQLMEIMMNSEISQPRSATKNSYLHKIWPNAHIPYIISDSYSRHERKIIARSMAEFHHQTCIRFIARTKQRDYIHIRKGDGCSSKIGCTGGQQTVSLGSGCVDYGTVIHELMHAAGFWHEQARYDRDDYVDIIWENIRQWPTDESHNFDKQTRSTSQDLGLPYDYSSVMHYRMDAFSRHEGLRTIIPKKRGAKIYGASRGFSKLDIEGLNLLYQCDCAKDELPACGECPHWESVGLCHDKDWGDFMRKNCRRSCNYCCQDHKDHADKCQENAKWGDCDTDYFPRRHFMRINCKKSCKLCSEYKSNC